MARAITTRKKTLWTVLAWGIGLLIFFPILWTFLSSFKSEATAIADPPVWFFFDWTLENYTVVQQRSNYPLALMNSIIIAVGSTLLGIVIAVPAAWAMAFVPGRRTKDVLLWMLSTKMLPAVGVLYPIVLIAKYFDLLDSRALLIIVLMLINLPIIIWMLYTYFREIPARSWRPRGWMGRRSPPRSSMSSPQWPCPVSRRRSFSTSSSRGTRRSGRSC